MAKQAPPKKKSPADKSAKRIALEKQDMEPTSADMWKKSGRSADHVPLPLPSGNTCLVQPLGLPELLRRGLIPNPLLETVTAALDTADLRIENPTDAQRAVAEKKARAKLDEQLANLGKDPAKMVAVFDMADAITLAVVVQPTVHPIPEPGEDGVVSREESRLYIDEVDLDDKFYIMNHAMSGTRDLANFREEFARVVGSSADGSSVADDPEPATAPDGV